jgi:serine/threonine-protein kinase ATR
MLTLWFDIGDRLYAAEDVQAGGRSGAKLRKVFTEVMSAINTFSDQLPLYKWLTALPQLTSRLSHNEKEVRKLVQTLVIRLLINFPDQVLWALVPMARSRDVDRATSAKQIIASARSGKADTTGMRADRELIQQFALVADQLVKLCNYMPKTVSKTGRPPKAFSLLQTFPALASLMPTRVMIPTQRSLTATLPPAGTNPTDHKPFPSRTATLFELRDTVSVLASLQRPKKLTVIGDDSEHYGFLCKPKDDLRKDLRMMEFTTMLNRLLARDAGSRKRRLYLRTFSVIPLTEDCGIIEWVPNTVGFRQIIQQLYAEDGLYNPKTTNADIKQLYEHCKGRSPASWMKEIVSKHPPVFHRWFLELWREPAAWFAARTAFSHTAAVWSMVGHVVGLGDRHGENILFDSTTGDAVHVDFSCLFDKGLELELPERVPFRLTQNLVDGLGVGGYEGVSLSNLGSMYIWWMAWH